MTCWTWPKALRRWLEPHGIRGTPGPLASPANTCLPRSCTSSPTTKKTKTGRTRRGACPAWSLPETARFLSSLRQSAPPGRTAGYCSKTLRASRAQKEVGFYVWRAAQRISGKKREELKEKKEESQGAEGERNARETRETEAYEDQELTGKTLPTFKLVDTPEGLPNTLFGTWAMVVSLELPFGYSYQMPSIPSLPCPSWKPWAQRRGGFLYLNRSVGHPPCRPCYKTK